MTKTDPRGDDDAAQTIHFNAVLYPNRSLSPLGFWVVMGLVAALSFGAGLAFSFIGAWPIAGFYGLDVLLIYAAFRWSYRQGRLRETIRLTDDVLEVVRVWPGGRRQEMTFQPYWVRVDLLDPEDHHSRLRVSSHGKGMEIGSFLSPEEREDLAQALQTALRRHAAGQRPSSSASNMSETE